MARKHEDQREAISIQFNAVIAAVKNAREGLSALPFGAFSGKQVLNIVYSMGLEKASILSCAQSQQTTEEALKLKIQCGTIDEVLNLLSQHFYMRDFNPELVLQHADDENKKEEEDGPAGELPEQEEAKAEHRGSSPEALQADQQGKKLAGVKRAQRNNGDDSASGDSPENEPRGAPPAEDQGKL